MVVEERSEIVSCDAPILITGAAGFMGVRLVERLLERKFTNLRCLVRPSGAAGKLEALAARYKHATIEIIRGNLLSKSDCKKLAHEIQVIYHLAAGTNARSFPDAFMNSVISTRNLLDATVEQGTLKRMVNVSSFTVYSNQDGRTGRLLDESGAVERDPHVRGDAYCFAKVRQDEIVEEYGRQYGIPYVIVRPGSVYGPGKTQITGRVGLNTFGIFLHLGGGNKIPLTYVDNCVDAILLAGLVKGIDGEIFNIVDDDLPSSRMFLRLYKKHVKSFPSIYVPHMFSYLLCAAWENYSKSSEEQLPLVFTRKRWHVEWKKTTYSNKKAKTLLGWSPRVSMAEGLKTFFEGCRGEGSHA